MLAGCQGQSLEEADLASQKQVEKVVVSKAHSAYPFDWTDSGRFDNAVAPYKAFGFEIGKSPNVNPKLSQFKRKDFGICGESVGDIYEYIDENNPEVEKIEIRTVKGIVVYINAILINEDGIFKDGDIVSPAQLKRHAMMITKRHGNPNDVKYSRQWVGYFFGNNTYETEKRDLYMRWQNNYYKYYFTAVDREVYYPINDLVNNCNSKRTAEALSGLMQKMGKFVAENQSSGSPLPSSNVSQNMEAEQDGNADTPAREGVKSIGKSGEGANGIPIFRIDCYSGREKYVMRKENKWTDNLGASYSNRTWSLSLEEFAKTICE